MTTIEQVAMQARPYPAHLLDGCETGLCLFAAAFLGWNDAVHFNMAGMRAMCVDIDGERLEEMTGLYPEEWGFHVDDAWTFAKRNVGKREWDAVSVDTFTGDAMRRSLDSLDLWCSLARKLVTVTVTSSALGTYQVPRGWSESLYERAESVYWLVLERA